MDASVVVALVAAFAAMFGSVLTYLQSRGTAARQQDHEGRLAELEHGNQLLLKAVDSEQAAELYVRRLRVGLVETFHECLAATRRIGAASLTLRTAEQSDLDRAQSYCRDLERSLAVKLAEFGQWEQRQAVLAAAQAVRTTFAAFVDSIPRLENGPGVQGVEASIQDYEATLAAVGEAGS